MTIHISNKNARAHVLREEEFVGSNLFAVRQSNAYVVFSYGKHWPLVAKLGGRWYVNTEKTSVSTQRQLSQCHPRDAVIEVDLAGMCSVLCGS